MEENIISVAVSVVCCLCYYLGWRVSRTSNQDNNQLLRDAITRLDVEKNALSWQAYMEMKNLNEAKLRGDYDNLKARYFREVLKLHKINFFEYPTQTDLNNVLSQTDLQEQSEPDEDNETESNEDNEA